MHKSPDVSPRRLSDISPQLRQLKYLVVDEAIKEDLKSSRSVEDINSASIEERILRITGYYGYQPWSTSYKSESLTHREMWTLVTVEHAVIAYTPVCALLAHTTKLLVHLTPGTDTIGLQSGADESFFNKKCC